jgi:branched-subunit amino acid aminotransferase/4-amino-4-deoxychorismate lyase
MKPATVKEIKDELANRPQKDLVELALHLARFKKDNKELLTYLLFEAHDENAFIQGIKDEIKEDFQNINRASYYYVKKSIRKILRNVKKYIRYSKKKETEVELLIYFCSEMKNMKPSMRKSITMLNLYARQMQIIRKTISTLHEDLQFDYNSELEEL